MLSVSKKTFDEKFKSFSVHIMPGEYYITKQPGEMIVTLLGSCVAACIRDPITQVGGVNHFLLAEPKGESISPSNRYGSYAMECLINEILKAGGVRNRLEVKLFGGSQLFNSSLRVGHSNAEFALQYVKSENLKLVAYDLGGNRPRRIHFWPETGKVMQLSLPPQDEKMLDQQEKAYSQTLAKGEVSGSVELF